MGRRRKRPPAYRPPPLSEAQILQWADAWFARFGTWPNRDSGIIPNSGGQMWKTINTALQRGYRGLKGGTTLGLLLEAKRGAPYFHRLRRETGPPPRLTVAQILSWADAHHARTGQWPKRNSGPVIAAAHDETWAAVDCALKDGGRGLRGGITLGRLLAEKRNAPYLDRPRRHSGPPPGLTVEEILSWADAHHRRTGRWPVENSGHVVDAPHSETWLAVTSALREGGRGLPGGSSLAELLREHRGVRNLHRLPPLTVKEILAWADAHHARTGTWPMKKDGRIPGTDETWLAIDAHLRHGGRGLAGGTSLAKFLARHRRVQNRFTRPALSEELILSWADDHYRLTGQWPTTNSGHVITAPREHWKSLDTYLRAGQRGLAGGSTLARLLAGRRGATEATTRPPG